VNAAHDVELFFKDEPEGYLLLFPYKAGVGSRELTTASRTISSLPYHSAPVALDNIISTQDT
jgi:hypothetical protein